MLIEFCRTITGFRNTSDDDSNKKDNFLCKKIAQFLTIFNSNRAGKAVAFSREQMEDRGLLVTESEFMNRMTKKSSDELDERIRKAALENKTLTCVRDK